MLRKDCLGLDDAPVSGNMSKTSQAQHAIPKQTGKAEDYRLAEVSPHAEDKLHHENQLSLSKCQQSSSPLKYMAHCKEHTVQYLVDSGMSCTPRIKTG